MSLEKAKVRIFRANNNGKIERGYHIIEFETPDGKVYRRRFKIIDIIALAVLYRKESLTPGWNLIIDIDED